MGLKNEISHKTENYAVDSVIQLPTKSILPHWSSHRPPASGRVKIKNICKAKDKAAQLKIKVKHVQA